MMIEDSTLAPEDADFRRTQMSGNLFLRWMGQLREGNQTWARKGLVINGHTHKFDHTTLLFGGHWRVQKWEKQPDDSWLSVADFECDGPYAYLIEAEAKHAFTFLGWTVPPWMEEHLALLPAEASERFRRQYDETLTRAVCVFPKLRGLADYE